MKIRTKTLLGYALVIAVMLITLFFLSQQLISSRFHVYTEQKSDETIARLEQLLQDSYATEMHWTVTEIEPLVMDFQKQGIIFDLIDQNGQKLIKHQSTDGQSFDEHSYTHHVTEETPLRSIELTYNGNRIGQLLLFSIPQTLVSNIDLDFKQALNNTFLISASVASLIGLFVALIVSHGMVKPIQDVTHVAQTMANGNYSSRAKPTKSSLELKKLSASINQLADTIEDGQMLRNRLTADISHELRTPLTSISGTIETIQSGIWQADENRLESLQQDVYRIQELIEHFSELEQYDSSSQSIEKKSINLHSYFSELAMIFEPLAIQSQNTLFFEIPNISVMADKNQMDRIFTNLLTNAIHYTKNGSISIKYAIIENVPQISISDTGIGIPKEELPFIFERLYRSDLSRSKHTGGQGIGLSIAKYAANIIGWQLAVESILSVGSTFYVKLTNA